MFPMGLFHWMPCNAPHRVPNPIKNRFRKWCLTGILFRSAIDQRIAGDRRDSGWCFLGTSPYIPYIFLIFRLFINKGITTQYQSNTHVGSYIFRTCPLLRKIVEWKKAISKIILRQSFDWVEDLNWRARIPSCFKIDKAFIYYPLVKQLYMAGCCK